MKMKVLEYIGNTSFNQHLFLSLIIRLLLLIYGYIQDQYSEVPYTDIDYKVVTDASRHILNGNSPFIRHTYRYSPILAYLQIPAILLHISVGKFIYCLFDIFVAIFIYQIVSNTLQSQYKSAVFALRQQCGKKSQPMPLHLNKSKQLAKIAALFWLYNPLIIVISTRGNGDSFSSFFVMLTIFYITKSEKSESNVFLAGLSHGVAIHLRLYPILFSLAYYLCLNKKPTINILTLFRPNKQQICLILGTVLSFAVVTGLFYHLYGIEYIYEAYVYHFVRKDVRHNFSLYFLMQYFSGNVASTVIEKLFIILPQILLMLQLTLSFGQSRQTIPFCIFAQTFVAVTYNSVVTSQYFVWYLALLPLCVSNLRLMPVRTAVVYFILWLLVQALWLFPAYLLEFKAWNTFTWIGGQAVFFFLINIFLLNRLIKYYSLT